VIPATGIMGTIPGIQDRNSGVKLMVVLTLGRAVGSRPDAGDGLAVLGMP
jgi:hypothetical protein